MTSRECITARKKVDMYNNEYMHVHENIFNIIITSVYPVCSGSKRKQVDDSGLDLAKLLDEYDKRDE